MTTLTKAIDIADGRPVVAVVGVGYIGLATAAMLASRGFVVHGIDTNSRVVESVNDGKAHIEDPGLADLVAEVVKAGRLRAHLKPQPADITIIATPTPIRHDDEHTPDLSHVMAAAKAIASVLKAGNLVILESTSPVGTTQQVARCITALRPDLRAPFDGEANPNLFFAYCPERIIPGQMLKELAENDRIIGGMDRRSAEMATVIYKELGRGHLLLTDDRTAEMVKLSENAYRDVNIAFANEMSMLCEAAGLDVFEVIKLANHHPRVSILRPGPGVGGHCIAVDPWFIVSSDPANSRLIAAARAVNDSKPTRVIEQALAIAATTNGAILCLGLTYKEDVGDFRESPSLVIARALTAKLGARVLCVDPFAQSPEGQKETAGLNLVALEEGLRRAGLALVLVPHKSFRAHSLSQSLRLIDTVGLFQEKAGPAVQLATTVT